MEIEKKVKMFLGTLELESENYEVKLSRETLNRLATYYKLLNEWNPRVHLVAPCSPAEFATRHVLESLFLLKYLPFGAKMADVGSGGGLPAIPCLMARPDLHATLIDSSKKKSVFLREALKRTHAAQSATVLSERFERVTGLKTDFVTCRALEHFADKLADLIEWSPPSSSLLLYGGHLLRRKLVQLGIGYNEELLPHSDRRFLFIVRRP